MNEGYGEELILDIEDCNIKMFTRRKLRVFFVALCKEIGTKRANLYFWDYDGDQRARREAQPHLAGISAVQFIETSDIRIHTLDKLKTVYLNIFSCKEFDVIAAKDFAIKFFGGLETNSLVITRGARKK